MSAHTPFLESCDSIVLSVPVCVYHNIQGRGHCYNGQDCQKILVAGDVYTKCQKQM